MKISGILDNCLNGQLCLRGYLNIKTLAKMSDADPSYQRKPIEGRHDISDFLETQQYLFFPEVILSYKLRYNSTDAKNPIELLQEGKKAKTTDGATIVPKKVTGEAVRVVELDIPDDLFTVEGQPKPFHRIDGNHRLLAAEKSENPKVETMVAPFCIILGIQKMEGGHEQETSDSLEFDKSVKVFFYNINTKTVPLTSEENLRVLIDDDKNFTDNTLENIFGGKYPICTRRLMKLLPDGILKHVPISDNRRTHYNRIFNRIEERDNESFDIDDKVEKVKDSLLAVDQLYNSTEALKGNDSEGLFEAFVYYYIKDTMVYNRFKDWIVKERMFDVKEISAGSLIRIFDKLYSKLLQVFVAMPYFGKGEVEEYNKIYSDSIDEINQEHGTNLRLFKIMSNEGPTQDQIQDIINKIKECEIFFADVTFNNANVSYELGWARALDKKCIIVKRTGSEDPKSDYQNDTYHEYDDNYRSISLAKVIKNNILATLTQYYGLTTADE